MSEDIKADETKSGEVKQVAANAPMEFQNKREALIKQFRGEDVKAPSASDEGSDADTDSQESESEAPAVSEQSGSSSVSEESQKEKNEKPKGDITKALQIERERRKEANKRFNELFEQTEALKKEVEALKTKGSQPVEQPEDMSVVDPEIAKKVDYLEAELRKYRQTDEQKAVAEKANAQATFIQNLNNDLEKEGYPGFELALTKMNGVIAKLVADGEYTASETHKPEVLKEIYREHLFEEIYPKFVKADTKRLMDEKKARKSKANLSSNPGTMPVGEDGDDKSPSQAELTQSYLASRKKGVNSRNNY